MITIPRGFSNFRREPANLPPGFSGREKTGRPQAASGRRPEDFRQKPSAALSPHFVFPE
jgi:hypothetical protein